VLYKSKFGCKSVIELQLNVQDSLNDWLFSSGMVLVVVPELVLLESVVLELH